ncbi:MAG TPA: LysR family transcriptional regulator [Alphaproteobacteria bacterium]|nr:LysR family transcriptional regulator [Alphaproteobacteria bacterium]
MDRFQSLQVFVKVAECGGFAAAARELAMSPPAVTRAVSALEQRIDTRLLIRTTRSVRLTESGERFLQDSRRILADLEEAEEAAVGSHAAPRGELRITAPVLFGRIYVTPILGDFLDCYPQVTCQTLFVDRIVNLMDEGLDVGIRIGELPDSSLTAIRAGSVCRAVFAAPSYLEKHGRPQHPRDLTQHRLIKSLSISSAMEWLFQDKGRPLSIPIEPRLRMNTNDAVAEMVARGWGISRLLSYQIAPLLAQGRVEAILTEFERPPIPIHVVHQEGRRVSSKVRAFVDFMVERLRADSAINK